MITRWLGVLSVLAVGFASVALGQTRTVRDHMPEVDVIEHLGKYVPKDVTFTDHLGQSRNLSELFDQDKPVLLNLAYHSCPVLCSMVIHATVEGLRNVEWTAGDEFTILTLSIDPNDTFKDAAEKRSEILERYGRDAAQDGWQFWVGDKSAIDAVAKAVGFEYRYDEQQGQYAHPAAIMLLSPDAKITRYLYGLKFEPRDLRLGLLESARGNALSTTEKIMLYCYQYEPGEGYVLIATRIMRLGGALTVLLLGGFLLLSWKREWLAAKKRPRGDGSLALDQHTVKEAS